MFEACEVLVDVKPEALAFAGFERLRGGDRAFSVAFVDPELAFALDAHGAFFDVEGDLFSRSDLDAEDSAFHDGLKSAVAHVEEAERALHVEQALACFQAKLLADRAAGQDADPAAGQEPHAVGVAALEQQGDARRGGDDAAYRKALALLDDAALRTGLLGRSDLQRGSGDLDPINLNAQYFERPVGSESGPADQCPEQGHEPEHAADLSPCHFILSRPENGKSNRI